MQGWISAMGHRFCFSSKPVKLLSGLGCAVVPLGAVLLSDPEPARGQEQGPPEAGTIELGTITVTARKKKEDLQDIPFSTTVVGNEELERSKVIDNRSLARRAPNVHFNDSNTRGFNRLIIRGVGDIGGGFAPDDNSVGYFINGVPVPLLGIDGDLFDVERVEILRGPQNVLFGRNAQGGAISVITADPAKNPGVTIGGEVGNQGQWSTTASLSGALSDQVSGRIAGQFRERDGDVPNDLGGKLRALDATNLMGTLKAEIDPTLTATAFGRYERQKESFILRAFLEDPQFPRVRLDTKPKNETKTVTSGLTVEKQFENVALTSLTGFYYGHNQLSNDQSDGRVFSALTGFPANVFDNPTIDYTSTKANEYRINQELRATGTVAGIDWMLGTNFFYSDLNSDNFVSLITTPLPFTGTFNSDIKTQSYDVFGSVNVPVGEFIEINAALRYTYEIERFRGGFVAAPPGAPVAINQQSQSQTFDFPTGRISASYALTPDVKAYLTYARGAKAGGFSNFDTNLPFFPGIAVSQFETARTDTYEAGAKGQLFDGRVYFNVAGFYNFTKDEQLAAFDFATFQARLENADTETYGGEFELAIRPIEGLLLQGALGVLETKILDTDPATGARIGGAVPNAPDVSLSLLAEYSFPIDAISAALTLGAEFQLVGERKADIGNTINLPAYHVVNLYAELAGESWKTYFSAKNVTNETFAVTAFPFGATPAGSPVSFAAAGQPFQFVVGAKKTF